MKLFITGTDTEIGKTYISVGILKAYNKIGLSTIGLKPIASGCIKNGKSYINEDTSALQNASSIKLATEAISPFMFEPAIAPHIAAKLINQELTLAKLHAKMQPTLLTPTDVWVIEGFGGWHAPLNHRETMADFVVQQQCKVILVVGIRIGCINHSLLTYKAMQRDGAKVIGWVANCIDPNMLYGEENISTLTNMLPFPCLGIIRYGEEPSKINLITSLENETMSADHSK